MGVDFYLRWTDFSDLDRDKQITGFATDGEAGYIREAYGNSVLVTETFAPESFDFHPCYIMPEGTTELPAELLPRDAGEEAGFITIDLLRGRMPAVKRDCFVRYDPDDANAHYRAFEAFLELAARKLDEGRQVWIYNSY